VQNKKFREFWLKLIVTGPCASEWDVSSEQPIDPDYIHVIEKAALDSALKEMDRLRGVLNERVRIISLADDDRDPAAMGSIPDIAALEMANDEDLWEALESHTQWRKENLGDDYE